MNSATIGLWVKRVLSFLLCVAFFVYGVVMVIPMFAITVASPAIFLVILWLLEGFAIRMIAHLSGGDPVDDAFDSPSKLAMHVILWPLWLWSFIQ